MDGWKDKKITENKYGWLDGWMKKNMDGWMDTK